MTTRDATTVELKSWHDFIIPKAFKVFTFIRVITLEDEPDVLTLGLSGRPPLTFGEEIEEELDQDKEEEEEDIEEVILT
ncbi:hypothetical protein BHE74_00020962 [Ensete ventricosum]|uniref:Uncharacterized protein n=1 Tax=Ensete ventricosum TaxID=4639 RepID=A0A444D976_ENSVE|nr:hypothetical protein GW17_00042734 [Ensete ventricosum]RWW71298.1 hypothetical protein BHE74_00020962 [Ensete ventricosum]RZR74759.1 hypothetical protein BHM03_00042702 [Ensete ventricosum]